MISIEMIDTSVKVATGILASALFFYWFLKRNQANLDPRERDEMEKRRQMLQQVAEQVGRVHLTYQQYLSLVVEYSRMGSHWPEHRRMELRKLTDELVAVFKELNTAQSTLLLLGEKKLEKALRVYGARIVSLRRVVSHEKNGFSGDDLSILEENKREIQTLKEAFFDTLSDRFLPRHAI